MRLRRVYLIAALTTVSALAACTLNPQPLPPKDRDNEATFGDGGFTSYADAGAPPPTGESTKTSTDAGSDALPASNGADAAPPPALDDAGDAGDAGDADAATES
jgi:hypothetical protein